MNECKLVNRKADGMPRTGNEYFFNAVEGQNNIAE